MFPGQFSNANQVVRGSGGSVVTLIDFDRKYRIHSFTGSGSFTLDKGAQTVERLIVGGGGGGGTVGVALIGVSGAGGGGGYVYKNNSSLAPGTYTVTVGAGGATDTYGSNSSLGNEIAYGGYQGAPAYTTGSWPGTSPVNYGSGASGAIARYITAGGTTSVRTINYGSATCEATPSGQGYSGGQILAVISGSDWLTATSGGGGAGGCGQQASWTAGTLTMASGSGGAAISNDMTGSNITYAGGGGGAGVAGNLGNNPSGTYNFVANTYSETGGNGAGFITSGLSVLNGNNAFTNRGGGGGAAVIKSNSSTNSSVGATGGQGGSGIVRIKYRID